MEQIYARHGDLVIRKEAVPSGFVVTRPTGPVVLAGHESAPHVIAAFQDVEYGTDGDTQRLRVTREVQLTHGGRHTTVSLEAGEYAIEPLAEMSGDIARSVED